ncbi:sialidase family protein [Adhaeribacter aquaticus]|uniref:sialidase family protein n=1 Tax=Adhaeribacter aquaticus TaxID=299567 RepID=UPI000411FBFA|nr:sialidase family protein [Adhaeribacter aquaticus]
MIKLAGSICLTLLPLLVSSQHLPGHESTRRGPVLGTIDSSTKKDHSSKINNPLGSSKNTSKTNSSTSGINFQSNGKTAIFLPNPGNDSRITNRKFEQVPSVVASADGKQLYAAWYSGGEAPGPGNFVTIAVSLDNGKTWLNDQFVVYPSQPSIRIFDPGLWRDKSGQIWLFYGSAGNNKIWDSKGGVNSLKLNWDGSKITYKDPKLLTYGVISNKPTYIPKQDKTFFAVYIDKALPEDVAKGEPLPKDGAIILAHDYKKQGLDIDTLLPYSTIVVPEAIRIHDEPQLVQTGETAFLGLVRTTKGIYATRSTDNGKTWSNVAPFTAAGPTTSSRFYIGKLKSGNMVLIANSSTTRNNMTAFLSKDGGKTWPGKLLLDARENVSYPDLDQSSDGTIHVVFDRDRTGAKDILYCRFKEEDVLAGSTKKVFKTRINSVGK